MFFRSFINRRVEGLGVRRGVHNGKAATSIDKAVSYVKNGDRVFLTGNAGSPMQLINGLMKRSDYLKDVEIYSSTLTLGPVEYLNRKYDGHFKGNVSFIASNFRDAVNEGVADYTPGSLSAIPAWFTEKVPIDVAFLHLSPPDEHGYCSFGVEVSCAMAAAEHAKLRIAQINPKMPRTLGDSFIHISKIDHWVQVDDALPTYVGENHDVFNIIGSHIAKIIQDGDCLQLGIGALPNGVLPFLKDKRNLGMHTEMFSDGIIDLVESGNINGAVKTLHHGKVVSSFCMGSQRVYDYIHDCPLFEFRPTEYVNDPIKIAKNDNMVAINAAIEVDLTGQVCADSIGTRFYSGVGGQLDFIRGAGMSKGGKPIIALPSTAKMKNGEIVSKIVPMLKQGAGVTTTRFDVHYIVTEFGAVDLHGKTIRQRVRAMIDLAHPNFREKLENEARKLHYL
jgi:acetyl-CoA hydrolase